ncbi:MAG: maleylpyruvate isomerase family mycothiol-dependent enzyme [Mycobacterium sp.]|uniref:maleylpyruvate isomerase family mycothiol-dependent enzyme n=1 Tax=Mycobacterium sp. TaxID=1785 RepID=UPI003C565710
MDRDQIFAATAQARRRIADLIDDLDEAQLATPSLCAGWDVKTVGAHLASYLAQGSLRVIWLGVRRGGPDRATDELARRMAQLPASEIAENLRDFADHRYWRPPPVAPGLLAEVLAHSGDMRIPLRLPFEPDPQLTATALDFLTGPVPLGLVPLRRLRGIRLQATDIDRAWGKGQEIRGRSAELLMATVRRTAVLDGLDGPGLALLRHRISG